jgi:hypothetical protein
MKHFQLYYQYFLTDLTNCHLSKVTLEIKELNNPLLLG